MALNQFNLKSPISGYGFQQNILSQSQLTPQVVVYTSYESDFSYDYLKTYHTFVKNTKLDSHKARKKWGSVLENAKIKNDYIIEWFATTCEYYTLMEEQLVPRLSSMSPIYNTISLPRGFTTLADVLKSLVQLYKKILEKDISSKLTIVRRYYNMITNQEGYELEGGHFVEGGQHLNEEISKQHAKRITDLLAEELDMILNPKLRKVTLRRKKLERILKDEKM